MREVVEHVSGIYPEANLYAAAWSLGANILVRYLGDILLTESASSRKTLKVSFAVQPTKPPTIEDIVPILEFCLPYFVESQHAMSGYPKGLVRECLDHMAAAHGKLALGKIQETKIIHSIVGIRLVTRQTALQKFLSKEPIPQHMIESHACPLSGAVSLCNPFNLVYAFEEFTKGFNRVYDKALARSIRNIFKRHILLFEDIGGEYNIPLALNARQVRDFDEGLTRVSFGFKSLDEYYYKASCFHSIKQVQVPLLCIQAANDPISPARAIPREEIEANRNCLLIVTPKGGHLGWVAGAEAPLGGPWTDPVVMDFLEHLERGTHKTVESSNGPLTATSKNLHHAEV
ncbi:hypothetical protein Gotri_017533 [Gossypium trilobum]|uniref:Embryogenesis-associated protein EMB8 n=1 Tax=Gossypium trilobum TaxID=34281 RepID=A0A7J9E6U6_9ROSI|nr:hypothetical protein [Gossypium trilobum]